jgi:uncharacterized protein (DUF2225 family)
MIYNGKCPIDSQPLDLQDGILICPQCGYSILQADFEKAWKSFDETKDRMKHSDRKAVRKLLNDLVVKYRIPKEEKHGSEEKQ